MSEIRAVVQQINGAQNVSQSGQHQQEARLERQREARATEEAEARQQTQEARQDEARATQQQEQQLALDQREGRGELVDTLA